MFSFQSGGFDSKLQSYFDSLFAYAIHFELHSKVIETQLNEMRKICVEVKQVFLHLNNIIGPKWRHSSAMFTRLTRSSLSHDSNKTAFLTSTCDLSNCDVDGEALGNVQYGTARP